LANRIPNGVGEGTAHLLLKRAFSGGAKELPGIVGHEVSSPPLNLVFSLVYV
jgi:hypothetical protein